MNRKEEIEARLAAIRKEMDAPDADIDALTEEVRSLKAELNQINEAAEKRRKLREAVSGGTGTIVRNFAHEGPATKQYTAASEEYRRAWLKNIAVDHRGTHIFGDLTEEEKRAFTFTTENTGEVVPTAIMNRIVELVENDSPIYDDSQKSSMTSGFSIPRHKSITAGDAKKVTEGAANDDEQDEFDSIDLPGIEIKKHIVLTRKMQFQSISAFEDWLVTHLAARVRVAKEVYLISKLEDTSAGIATANKVTGAALDDAGIRKVLGLLKGSGVRVLYANSSMIWNTIAGLTNEKGEKLFIPNSMADPVIEGRVYGTIVKKDSNVPDDTFYVGYPIKLLSNNFVDFDITPQIEPKTLNRIFVAYSLFDGGLEDPEAFAKWSKSGG